MSRPRVPARPPPSGELWLARPAGGDDYRMGDEAVTPYVSSGTLHVRLESPKGFSLHDVDGGGTEMEEVYRPIRLRPSTLSVQYGVSLLFTYIWAPGASKIVEGHVLRISDCLLLSAFRSVSATVWIVDNMG